MMNKHHILKMAEMKYPGRLRIIECEECRYAFAAEVNEFEVVRMDTKIHINEGDIEAAHSFFQAPLEFEEIELEKETEAELETA